MTIMSTLLLLLLVLCLWFGDGFSQLSADFYSSSCPSLQPIVFSSMQRAVQTQPRNAASILRLFFHDCFVQGCDGSILLDDVAGFQGEKTAVPNRNSARGFEVIDEIKSEVEAACQGVVSCADILALASRDGVVLLNGPSWDVLLGRRDSKTASLSGANSSIPAPSSNLTTLISMFQTNGLSPQDLVVLSGAHTIGLARCFNFKQRLYNQSGSGMADPTIDAAYLTQLKGVCPPSGGDNNTSPLDRYTPTSFDTEYFSLLQNGQALLNSDEVLYSTNGSSTKYLVEFYGNNPYSYFEQFKASMIKMGNINPLTGTNGEIRKNCRLRN